MSNIKVKATPIEKIICTNCKQELDDNDLQIEYRIEECHGIHNFSDVIGYRCRHCGFSERI